MTDPFDATKTNGSDVTNTTMSDDDIVASLVGEGKKYKTVADLAKGKINADQFIEQLKTEKAEVLALARGQEELIKAARAGAVKESDSPGTTKSGGDEGSLDEKVSRIIEQRTVEQRRKENLDNSVNTLKSKLGDLTKVQEAIHAKAVELGMTNERLKEMAQDSPVAFLTIMGVTAQPQTPQASGATKGSTTAAPSTGSSVKNFAYFEGLRKEMGSKFYDAKIQNELFKARRELGERFYS